MGCIQETMLERYETRGWNMVGRGFLEGFLAVNANGRSGGVVIAWNKMVFAKVASRMGQFLVVVKLKRHRDGCGIDLWSNKCQEGDRVMGGTYGSGYNLSRVTHADGGVTLM